MDATTYAAIVETCARLAGRLSDDVLGTIREHYAAGEWQLAGATLIGNLEYQDVGITEEERHLIHSFLEPSEVPDLLDVPAIAEVPPLAYHFRSTHPTDAPDPSRADSLFSSYATRIGIQRIHRTWRDPLGGAPDGPTWIYVIQVVVGRDQLKTFSGLTAVMWSNLREKWPIEVFAEGAALTPYQTAALGAAQLIWTA